MAESSLFDELMGVVGWLGESAAKGQRAVTGTISGVGGGKWGGGLLNLIPFSDTMGITDPRDSVSGRDLLEQWGALEPNQEGLDAGDVGGYFLEEALDPLNWAGGFLAKRLFGAAKGFDAIPDVMRATDEFHPLDRMLSAPDSMAVERQLAAGRLHDMHANQLIANLDDIDLDAAAGLGAHEIDLDLPGQPLQLTDEQFDLDLGDDIAPGEALDFEQLMADADNIQLPQNMPAHLTNAVAQPATGYYSRLDRAVENLPGDSIKYQSLHNQLKRSPEGYHPEELAWSGGLSPDPTETGKVTKQELRDYLAANPRNLERVEDTGKWSNYSLPGGRNYKNTLLTLPDNPMTGGQAYHSSHWSEPNVLVHLRTKEFDAPGGKSLIAQEIQSDWHQEGAKLGYMGQMKPHTFEAVPRGNVWSVFADDGTEWVGFETEAEALEAVRRFTMNDPLAKLVPPNAPFKEDWPLLGLKELIRQGVEGGYDEVGWIPGERVASMVGGKMAGQKQFYDRQLVNSANKYLRSRGWNTTVQNGMVKTTTKSTDLDRIDRQIERMAQRWQLAIDANDLDRVNHLEETMLQLHANRTAVLDAMQGEPYFRIPITPEMKAAVQSGGQPLLSMLPPALFGAGLGSGLAQGAGEYE